MTSELFTRAYLTIFTSESCQASGASFLVHGRGKTRDEGCSSAFRAKNQELHDSQLKLATGFSEYSCASYHDSMTVEIDSVCSILIA